MKHGVRPSLKEKKLMKSLDLEPKDWLVVSHTTYALVLKHRTSNKVLRLRA